MAHGGEAVTGPSVAAWAGAWPAGPSLWLGLPVRPRYAPVWVRGLAWAIDWAILGVVNYATVVAILFFEAVYVEAGDTGQAAAGWLLLVLSLVVVDGLYVVPQEALWGRTLGKRALGIRVERAGGGSVDATAALVRYLFVFPAVLGLGGLVTAATIAASDTRQRLGDRAAGTIVVWGR